MRKVEIKNKVVARGGGKEMMGSSSATGAASVDLSGVLMKSIWDKVFEIKTTVSGEEYLYGKLPIALQYGLNMYIDGGMLDLPSIYQGLPIDNNTIYWENIKDEEGNIIDRRLKARGGEGGSDIAPTMLGDLTNVGSWANGIASEDRIMVQKKGSSLWTSLLLKDLVASGNEFVTLDTDQLITGKKDFVNGLSVGGLELKKSKDDVLYIDANVVVRGGVTSYVDGGDLDLPSIYDGLPIDGDTLYWVLDENGKKVMLKSKGEDEEGGGSVQFPLSWSGYSSGSWDGSEAKTIAIPSKLSDLENDGKFFANGGWIGGDANSVIFGSYLYGGISAHTPKNEGQLLAFNNGNLEAWNRGSQIFIEGENFYYRQFWDNYWRNWRRVISENADGVIDYDLTLGGSLNMPSALSKIKCGDNSILECYGNGSDTYVIGKNYLYLTTQNLFLQREGKVYKILHVGNYKDYEYTAKWLRVVDTRNTTPEPSDIETFAVTAQFTNADNPGRGWHSGISVQGWSNEFKVWQLRAGADATADNHLYYRNGQLSTWNDWRRVITGDVYGVIDFNLEIKGEEGGNIKFVHNNDNAITTNKPNELASIRHALRFPWYGDAYEIGTVRSDDASACGFGVTYQKNQLVWRVGRERMDVYGDLRIKNGLIRYNDTEGYFYLDGNVAVKGTLNVGGIVTTDITHGYGREICIGDADNNSFVVFREDIKSSKEKWSIDIYGKASFVDLIVSASTELQSVSATSLVVSGDSELSEVYASSLDVSGSTTLQGDVRLRRGNDYYGSYLYFGDGSYCYIAEQFDDMLTIAASNGITMEGDTTVIGNLLVTGGMTMYGTAGNIEPFLIDATSWTGLTSDSKIQVYTANAVTLLKDKVADIRGTIKSALTSINSSSSASAIGAALNTIYKNI